MDFRDVIPNEEQQLYIDAKLALRELEQKNRVSDSDYQIMVDEINSTLDPEQRARKEEWLQDFISESEYFRVKEENEKWIDEINEKYGLSEDFERSVDAKKKRQQLVRLRTFFNRNNQEFLDNRDISLLSDEDVILEYNRLEYQYGRERLNEMLNEDTRYKLDELRKEREEQRVDEKAREELEKRIKEYNENVETIDKRIKNVNASLTLGDIDDLRTIDMIQQLDTEVKELVSMGESLVADMDEFKSTYNNIDLSTNYQEMMKKLNKIKIGLGIIKRKQVKIYNTKVEILNDTINKFKEMNNPKIDGLLSQLPQLFSYDKKVDWRSDYFSVVKYDDLISAQRILLEINKIVEEEKNKDNVSNDNPNNSDNNDNTSGDNSEDNENIGEEKKEILNNLEKQIEKLRNAFISIESEIKDEMSQTIIDRLRQDINFASDDLNSFYAMLENNRDKLSDEEYNKFVDAYNQYCEFFMDLNTKLNQVKIISIHEDTKVYTELMHRAKFIKGALENMELLVNSLFAKVNSEVQKTFLNYLHQHYEVDLNSLETLIEEKYNMDPRQLDENQYNNLKKEIEEIKTLIEKINDDLLEVGMVKNNDVSTALSDELDSIKKEIAKLKEEINKIDGKLSREDRKKYDSLIGRLGRRLNKVKKFISPDKDSNEYGHLDGKFNEVNNDFEELNKEYRGKCPLMVKGVKAAGAFFRKHKKTCLVVAGLAAMAVVSHQVLIPAIIHGNMMIWQTVPALRGFVEFTNRILGGVIGAREQIKNAWVLANGVAINPSIAATSLLKGLAISSVNSMLLVTPLILAIKKLVEKMKTAELRQKFSVGLEKQEEKVKETVSKFIKHGSKNFEELAKEYVGSKLTFEEFCNEKELTETEKERLELTIAKMKLKQQEKELNARLNKLKQSDAIKGGKSK